VRIAYISAPVTMETRLKEKGNDYMEEANIKQRRLAITAKQRKETMQNIVYNHHNSSYPRHRRRYICWVVHGEISSSPYISLEPRLGQHGAKWNGYHEAKADGRIGEMMTVLEEFNGFIWKERIGILANPGSQQWSAVI
jgi:hypothetical protein